MPPIMEGDELYDLLMGKIEPDLTTKNLPGLKEKYKGESKADAASRSERYQKAFEEYEKHLQEYGSKWNAQLHSYKETAIASIEQADRKNDLQQIQDLESAITSS